MLLLIIYLIDNARCLFLSKIYNKEIKARLIDLQKLCNPSRIFTDQECDSFQTINQQLFQKVVKLYNELFFRKVWKEKYDILKFVDTYREIKQLQKENNQLNGYVSYINNILPLAYSDLNKLLDFNHYFTHSECKNFQNKYNDLYEKITMLICKSVDNCLSEPIIASEFSKKWSNLSRIRKDHNDDFKNTQLRAHKDFFDSVLTYPLDDQQRDSIVTLEDNCLVISSAGSGKTSTMVGKIEYLVHKRGVPSSKILAITYTRKAAQELKARISNDQIECKTFHRHALDIISAVTGQKPTIAPAELLLNCFYSMLKTKDFVSNMVRYIVDYQSGVKDIDEYQSASEYYADRKKYGIQSLFPDVDGNFVFTKSEEEKKICSILSSLDIKYRYEYPYEFNTRTPDYRQYQPDFTIYYLDRNNQWRRIYLEHFAINDYGQVPKWFGSDKPGGWVEANRIYNEGIRWKKNTHINNHTNLIFTTSADFKKGIAKERIIQQLQSLGVPMRDVPAEELYQRVISRNKNVEKALFQMCESFITLLKANKRSIVDILNETIKDNSRRNYDIVANIMRPLYEHYETALVTRNEIDFIDPIIKATDLCNNGLCSNYDYILVDEFQDISIDRYLFLKSLRKTEPLTKLFCVGDDWQSIYRFAGSDMALFTDFEKYFGFTEECKIETTYRFGNPLIEKSSEFIQQNPSQKQKNIHPRMINREEQESVQREKYLEYLQGLNVEKSDVDTIPHIKKTEKLDFDIPNFEYFDPFSTSKNEEPKFVPAISTELDFVGYEKDEVLYDKLSEMIKSIPSNKSIYIMGRYTYDADAICKGKSDGLVTFDDKREKITVNFENREVPFLTVHSSKGLEADYVFLIRCNNGINGFPSMISDDPVLDYVLSEDDHYEYGEERRVFYVAITRAKEHTYVLYENSSPSPFVTEMIGLPLDTDQEECPLCHDGHKIVKKRGTAVNGNEYTIWGCSNRAAGCQYHNVVWTNYN